jgi:hypothetical protein
MREEASREHEALKRLDPSLAEAFARLLGSPPIALGKAWSWRNQK